MTELARLGVVVPDLHIPNHNKRALNAVFQFLMENTSRIDVFALLGDYQDMEGVSPHPPISSRVTTIANDVRVGNRILDRFDRVLLPGCDKHFFMGNHDEWLERYILSRAPGLDGLIALEDLLRLEERGYKAHPHGQLVKLAGRLHAVHGWFTGNNHPTQTAVRAGCSVVYGHAHDMASYTHHYLKEGYPILAQSLGCLCDLNPKYMRNRPNKWVHGFGVFEMWGSGYFTLHALPIVRGKFCYEGKVYGG